MLKIIRLKAWGKTINSKALRLKPCTLSPYTAINRHPLPFFAFFLTKIIAQKMKFSGRLDDIKAENNKPVLETQALPSKTSDA